MVQIAELWFLEDFNIHTKDTTEGDPKFNEIHDNQEAVSSFH